MNRKTKKKIDKNLKKFSEFWQFFFESFRFLKWRKPTPQTNFTRVKLSFTVKIKHKQAILSLFAHLICSKLDQKSKILNVFFVDTEKKCSTFFEVVLTTTKPALVWFITQQFPIIICGTTSFSSFFCEYGQKIYHIKRYPKKSLENS